MLHRNKSQPLNDMLLTWDTHIQNISWLSLFESTHPVITLDSGVYV